VNRKLSYFLGLFLAATTVYAAEDVVIRVSADPQEAWVGQRVVLSIDVLGKSGWAQIPAIRPPQVNGAYVMNTDSQGIRLQETIDGESYTGQRYALSLYPQRPGEIAVPPSEFDVTIRELGIGGNQTVHAMTTSAFTISAIVPPGAENVRGLISTRALEADQSWSLTGDVVEMNVGDAIKRTISMEAADTSGMAFTPLDFEPIVGVGVYPGEPSVDDRSDRGTLTGKREETFTFVFESPGEYELPNIPLRWFDMTANEMKTVDLPGRTIQVRGMPAGTETTLLSSNPPANTRGFWVAGIIVAILGLLGFRYRTRAVLKFIRGWNSARNSEWMHFQRAVKSVRADDPHAALNGIMKWLDHINENGAPARLDTFFDEYGDAVARNHARLLADSLSSPNQSWDAKALRSGLKAARKGWKSSRRRKKNLDALLPELNQHSGEGR
jgi:hypothetical protein